MLGANEQSLLLHDLHRSRQPTPLPRLQVSILLILQMVEPITAQCIYPFIVKVVSELDVTGGDEKKTGYYSGLIASMFFLAEATTIFQWSRLSDNIGRKPVLLLGIAGVATSMILFGLSRTLWTIIFSRCLSGFLNGNAGVIKSMMAELTDSTNMAQGFALFPVVWVAGTTIGPFIGGQLYGPYERFPRYFGGSLFWKEYPYFLPCAVTAGVALAAFALAFFYLKETVDTVAHKDKTLLTDGLPTEQRSQKPPAPLPLRAVLTTPVLISVLNYTLLALIDGGLRALQPLFYATPIKLGGLGLSPPIIGTILGTFGILNGVFQVTCFPRIHRRFGSKRVFVAGMSAFVPIFAAFPVINSLAERNDMGAITWCALATQLLMFPMIDMAYACSFIFVTSAAPSKRSLGATNGLAQTTSSLARAIAPAASTSMFAVSVERNILGGSLAYLVLVTASCAAVIAAWSLPYNSWERCDD